MGDWRTHLWSVTGTVGMEMTMENGWKTQLIFNRIFFDGGEYDTGYGTTLLKQQTAPRMLNVRNVLEEYELFDKAVYQEHAQAILQRHPATSGSTCWNVVHDEHVGRRKDGVLRRTLEELGMPPDPKLGVICIAGSPRTMDSRAMALELDLGLGAHGGTRFMYPLRNFPHTWMLVRVSDAKTLEAFAKLSRRGETRTGQEYHFWGELHVDPSIGRNELSTKDAEALLKQPPRRVKLAEGSNFKDAETQRAEQAWFDTIDSLREKLGQ